MQLIDQIFKCKARSPLGLGLRAILNLVIMGLSMGLGADAVNIVVSFIGALPSCCMVLILPTLLATHVQYAVDHPDENRLSWHYWKMAIKGTSSYTSVRIRALAYLIIALLIMVIGTYSIVEGLVTKK